MPSESEWRAVQSMLGIVPDREIAERLGCSVQAVYQRRRKLNIKAAIPRENDPGLPARDVRAILERADKLLRGPDLPWFISISRCAADLGVDQRTLRRWLDGRTTPPGIMLRRLQRWIATAEAKMAR